VGGVDVTVGVAAAVSRRVEVDASEWIVPASFLRFEGCSLGGLGVAMVAEAALDRPAAFRVVGAMDLIVLLLLGEALVSSQSTIMITSSGLINQLNDVSSS
jgi:hypothetical protein